LSINHPELIRATYLQQIELSGMVEATIGDLGIPSVL
jgi:hypothetical protein